MQDDSRTPPPPPVDDAARGRARWTPPESRDLRRVDAQPGPTRSDADTPPPSESPPTDPGSFLIPLAVLMLILGGAGVLGRLLGGLLRGADPDTARIVMGLIVGVAIIGGAGLGRRKVRPPEIFSVLPGPADPVPDLSPLGARGAALRTFAERLGALEGARWEQLLKAKAERGRWSAARRRRAFDRAMKALRESGRHADALPTTAALLRAALAPRVDEIGDLAPSYAYEAAVGLLARDLVPRKSFLALYGAFAEAIPAAELEDVATAAKLRPASQTEAADGSGRSGDG